MTLSVEETTELIQSASHASSAQTTDLLLTALMHAYAEWSGQQSLLIDLEGHGREEILERIDLSRTVGWFTTIFPVLLRIKEGETIVDVLKRTKEEMRRIPSRGIGYGLLKYLTEDDELSKQLRGSPQAEVSFNYLGQFDRLLPDSALFKLSHESVNSYHSLHETRRYLIDINLLVAEGRLRLHFTYSDDFHQSSRINALAQGFQDSLRSLAHSCLSLKAPCF